MQLRYSSTGDASGLLQRRMATANRLAVSEPTRSTIRIDDGWATSDPRVVVTLFCARNHKWHPCTRRIRQWNFRHASERVVGFFRSAVTVQPEVYSGTHHTSFSYVYKHSLRVWITDGHPLCCSQFSKVMQHPLTSTGWPSM